MGLFDFLAEAKKPQVVAWAQNKMKTNNELVMEIHNQFYTASDRLLAEAKAIIENPPTEFLKRGKRLADLGFTNSRVVQQANEAQALIDKKTNEAKTLADYAMRYPLYRFITEGEIGIICAKYGLVQGQINKYKGDVPDKNIREIENAGPLAPQDEMWAEINYGIMRNSSTFLPKSDVIKQAQAEERRQEKVEQEAQELWRLNAELGLMTIPESAFDSAYTTHSRSHGYTAHKKAMLHICAPLKDMDTSGMEVKGHNLVKIEVPDPVVLERTSSGLWRIITAWGLEASDPLVINPKMN